MVFSITIVPLFVLSFPFFKEKKEKDATTIGANKPLFIALKEL